MVQSNSFRFKGRERKTNGTDDMTSKFSMLNGQGYKIKRDINEKKPLGK